MMMKLTVLISALFCANINAFAPISTTSNSQRQYDTKIDAALMLDGQEIRGPITPLGNFVLVRTKDTLASTSGGILLPDQVRKILVSWRMENSFFCFS